MSKKASLLSKIFVILLSLSPSLKRKVWRWWYDLLAKKDASGELMLMNYGYVPLEANPEILDLETGQEKYRYALQLYQFISQGCSLEGKKVLEVGSGRGGGAIYLGQSRKPASYTGLDLSYHATSWARKHSPSESITFIQGQSDTLPFLDNSLDVVINVESSHCYPDFRKFIQETIRVLIPGGYLLFCDFRPAKEVEKLYQDFEQAGFELVRKVDITPNVVAALDLANDNHKTVIQDNVPRFMQAAMADFSGIQDTAIYSRLRDRSFEYTHAVLRKSG